MKLFGLVFQIFLSIIFAGFLIYFLTGYDSAFEADQSCHSYLSIYDNQPGKYDCDHDTETHKWILYSKEDNSVPAKIIKKFRYKFL